VLHTFADPLDPSASGTRRRLDSWKEIARYLGRDVTTVRRWEKGEGLPIHRHLHRKLGSVYAYSNEIDTWWKRRSTELTTPETEPVRQSPRPAGNGRAGFTVGVALNTVVVLLLAITSSHIWMPRVSGANLPIVSIALPAPEGTLADALALSPDGTNVAFAAMRDNVSRIWIRPVKSMASRSLPGTDGAAFPFWSADATGIGFFAGGRLKRVVVATDEVVDLAAAPNGRGGAWNEHGEIVFSPDDGAALFRVPADGGPVTAVTTLGPAAVEGHAWPEFLPGGRHLIYTDYTIDTRRYGICLFDLDSRRTSRLVAAYSSGAYVPSGHILYKNKDGALVAQRFNLFTRTASGLPVVVADRVFSRYGIGHRVDVSVSRTGLIAARNSDDVHDQLVLVDRTSRRVIRRFGAPAFHSNPTLSPDGRQLLATIGREFKQPFNMWQFDVADGEGSRLTFGSLWDGAPVWAADGLRVIFASLRDRRAGIYERHLDNGADEWILPASFMQVPESLSRDGRYLTYQKMGQGTRFDVWAWDLVEKRTFPVIATTANEGNSQISPDGRYVAYASDETGSFEVYVRPFLSGTDKDRRLVSSHGGVDPRWRRDGLELYYIADDRMLNAVSVTTSPAFQQGKTTPLFDSQVEYLWQDTRNHYDVTPDGRRFVLVSPVTDRRAAPFTLIVNWRY
jgi:Tol biopolymer transport system component